MKHFLIFILSFISIHTHSQINKETVIKDTITELSELIINTPSKQSKKIQVGKKNEGDLYLYLPRGIEFITEVPFKRKQIGKQIFQLTYPIQHRGIFPNTGNSSIKINIYDEQKKLLFTDIYDNIDSTYNSLDITINKKIIIPKSRKLYIGIESLEIKNKPYYSNLCFLIDPMYETAYYKEIYDNNNNWLNLEKLYNKERMKIIITKIGEYNGSFEIFSRKYKNSIPIMHIYLEK